MASSTGQSSLHSRMLALAALQMGFSMISSAFGFYYVKIFLNYYHIQESWFQIAQTLFMIWNAINDPLFAYLQDSTNFSFTRTRRESVLYAAPLFAISFLVPWFPWGNPKTMASWVTGIHLITALCFWDTMFTYVGLAACCLFTEITQDNATRLKMVQYGKIGSLLGSTSVFFLQYMSNQLENFRMFQAMCVIIAIISCMLMRYCGKHCHTEQDLKNNLNSQNGQSVPAKSQEYSYFAMTKQILLNRDFIAFVIMNFLQEFHKTYLSNFLVIFCDQLVVKGDIPDLLRSAFYGGTHMLANILVIVGAQAVGRFGYFNVIRSSYVLKIGTGLFFFVVGPINVWCIMLFLFLDITVTDSVFSLFNLPLSDIADADTVRYNRRHRATSMVYGTNALVVKPAISLAPMFVVAILNRYGYEKLRDHKLDPTELGTLNSVMFYLMCLIPACVGLIQFFAWSLYTIRHKKNIDMTMLVEADCS